MPRHVYLFSGLPPWEDLGAEGPASPAGRGRHRSLRLQDRLPEDRGRGALSAHGATLCDGSERGHLPGSFLVSNLPELWDWADRLKRDTLVIETAGLCHRCSPATQHMTAGCVLDCTASCRASGQLGPMLTQADFVVLTKIDMVSQAELEIISWQIRQINPGAALFRWTVWRAMEPTFGPVAAGPACVRQL